MGTATLTSVVVLVLLRAVAGPEVPLAYLALVAVAGVGLQGAVAWTGSGPRPSEHRRRASQPPGQPDAPPGTGRDPLTGLADREGLADAIDIWSVGPGAPLTLTFHRIDRFDLVNDQLSRDAGDRILVELARRLQRTRRATAVARVGGATFAVLGVGHDAEDADGVAATLDALGTPIVVDGATLLLTTSAVVVSVSGTHGDGRQVLERAEAAVRAAPAGSSADPVVVDVDLDHHGAPPGCDGAARLAAALDVGEVMAHYQPVVDLRAMAVEGVEALARWPAGGPGLTEPEEFVALARAAGLGSKLTDVVLRQACRDFATGVPAALGWWVSVNVSEPECTDPTLAHRIASALADSGLEPGRLIIEVSERVVPHPEVARCLAAISELGVRIAIDDFGSGWSSLAQLRTLPIELVKLDRSLVSDPGPTPTNLCTAALALGHALGLRTLAEGIETGEQLLVLCIGDCDLGQGFWWTEPTTLDDLVARFGPDRPDDDPYRPLFGVGPASDQPDQPGADGAPA